MKKKIAFYAEAGKEVGLGHFVRSSALATFFRERNYQVDFLIKEEALTKKVELELKKFNMIPIPRKAAKFKWTEQYLKKEIPHVLVVDSYEATSRDLKNLKKFTKILVSIDDLASICFPSDVIVNGNIYASTMKYKTCGKALLLLGTNYTILRRVFQRVRKKSVRKSVKNVSIIMGGADISGITLPVLETVAQTLYTSTINVVLGPYVDIDRVRDRILHKRINLYKSPSLEVLKNLMEKADLAISAGGQTLYELARCGVPAIGVCVGRDQTMNLDHMNKAGCCVSIGWAGHKGWIEKLKSSIENLSTDVDKRRTMAIRGQKLVDGLGGLRVRDNVISLLEKK